MLKNWVESKIRWTMFVAQMNVNLIGVCGTKIAQLTLHKDFIRTIIFWFATHFDFDWSPVAGSCYWFLAAQICLTREGNKTNTLRLKKEHDSRETSVLNKKKEP